MKKPHWVRYLQGQWDQRGLESDKMLPPDSDRKAFYGELYDFSHKLEKIIQPNIRHVHKSFSAFLEDAWNDYNTARDFYNERNSSYRLESMAMEQANNELNKMLAALKKEGKLNPTLMAQLERVGRGLHENFGIEASYLGKKRVNFREREAFYAELYSFAEHIRKKADAPVCQSIKDTIQDAWAYYISARDVQDKRPDLLVEAALISKLNKKMDKLAHQLKAVDAMDYETVVHFERAGRAMHEHFGIEPSYLAHGYGR